LSVPSTPVRPRRGNSSLTDFGSSKKAVARCASVAAGRSSVVVKRAFGAEGFINVMVRCGD
jgi:hypothetical protein